MLNHALIVEDDEVTLFLTQTVIEKSRFVKMTDVATDGLEAYRFLCEHKTDVVFLDISLPVMTGLELLEKCRTQPGINVPFIVLSSTDREAELAEKGEYPQVIMHLRKPLSTADMEQVKNAVLTHKRVS